MKLKWNSTHFQRILPLSLGDFFTEFDKIAVNNDSFYTLREIS